jgi:hypothetical protein
VPFETSVNFQRSTRRYNPTRYTRKSSSFFSPPHPDGLPAARSVCTDHSPHSGVRLGMREVLFSVPYTSAQPSG